MGRYAMRSLAKIAIITCACAALARGAMADGEGDPKPPSPIPDLNPGEGWVERPVLPPKGGDARAWSDPAAGCHLSMFTLPASKNIGEAPMRTSLVATLAESKLAISDDESGFMRITGVAIDGLAKLQVIDKPVRSASLVACYWNEREPARCQSHCKRTLQDRVD